MTGSLIDNEQGGFRAGKGCLDQIFTLKRISEKVQKKKHGVYADRHMIGLIGKLYGRF